MGEEFVGAEVLDVDTDQLTGTAIDGMEAHLLEVVRHVVEVTEVTHVDVAPHGRVLADIAPQSADVLCVLEDFDGAKPEED